MPDMTRIATCCYCGTRSVLELTGRTRRELTCPACGAHLSEMKRLKADHPGKRTQPRPPPKHHPLPERPVPRYGPPPSRRETRRRTGPRLGRFLRKAVEEVADAIEDIFD